MKKKLTPDEVRGIQLELLLATSRFCEKHHLRYYLAGGTLLGAIRHKGFIPWDDDIDLLMPREDFNRLLAYGKRQRETDRVRVLASGIGNGPYPFIKIADTWTSVKEQYMDERYSIHIWIDIFPLDGMPEEELPVKIRFARIRFLRTLLEASISEIGKGATPLTKAVKYVLVPLCRNLDKRLLGARMNRLASRYDLDSSPCVGGFLWGYGPCEKMPRSFLDAVEVEFEGHRFPAPGCWDEYLSGLYGDYMQLPPEEKRIRHGFEAWRIHD